MTARESNIFKSAVERVESYRKLSDEMRHLAKEIDSRKALIEALQREISPLQDRLNLIVRLPHESYRTDFLKQLSE